MQNMIGFTMLDWADEIETCSLLSLVKKNFPGIWGELNVGCVKRGNKLSKYKTDITKHEDDMHTWDGWEWYGGVLSKSDPDREWRSYLSLDQDDTRKFTLCSSLNELSFKSLMDFIRDASRLGNLGYGVACERSAEDIAYYLSGITYGMPESDDEKALSKQLSRWFQERLNMGGSPAKKRYLKGMHRGAFPLNVLNESHIVTNAGGEASLRGVSEAPGEISQLHNGVYMWSIPHKQLEESDHLLGKAGLLI